MAKFFDKDVLTKWEKSIFESWGKERSSWDSGEHSLHWEVFSSEEEYLQRWRRFLILQGWSLLLVLLLPQDMLSHTLDNLLFLALFCCARFVVWADYFMRIIFLQLAFWGWTLFHYRSLLIFLSDRWLKFWTSQSSWLPSLNDQLVGVGLRVGGDRGRVSQESPAINKGN